MKAPTTSVEAIPAPDDIKATHVAIAADIVAHGPATSAQLAERLKLTPYAVSKRTSELVAGKVLKRIGRARNSTGRWASVLGSTDITNDFVDGYAELAPPPHKTRRDRLGRALKAARQVATSGKPSNAIAYGFVGVPMDDMVELISALADLDDVRLVPR